MRARFKRYLFTGLLVWVPVGVTLFIIQLVVQATDRIMVWVPADYRPETWLGYAIPGIGIVVGVVLLLLTGLVVSNVLGRKLVQFWESILSRIPVVRSIYSSAKQVSETLFSDSNKGFKTAVLAPFPQTGSWAVGFITNTDLGEIQAKVGEDKVGVFLPSAPPTQGYSIIIARDDLIELEMSVDEALKYVISLGVVVPPWPPAGATRTSPDADKLATSAGHR